ncbi:hypothetical protein LCGC14_2145820 [marine sediment metagenome]|uniref:Four helix bundle protein n=1 Tax=marine sediment metagenome TaxID=412755 RepID=A0A0F9DX85_9ZZZZ
MTEKSKYRDWKVWKDAVEVGVEVMGLDDLGLLEEQVKRTAVSISANIAEGATGDKLAYGKARRATARLETYLILLNRRLVVSEETLKTLLNSLEGIHAQLGALMRKVSY